MRFPRVLLTAALCGATGASCGAPGPGASPEEVVIEVPVGAPFDAVVDTLEARGLVGHPSLFGAYARLRGVARAIRAGSYSFPADAGWDHILDDLVAGRILTVPVTIPEGFTLPRIAERIAPIVEDHPDTVRRRLQRGELLDSVRVPGPGLEGFLFPDTYRFARGTSLVRVVRTMVERYREFWTPERRARLDSLEMTEAELVTLASIVQAEGRVEAEMDTIASVYHNRLARGYRLEADPTVLYALGGHRERLLYAAMDSVADHPYNTYTRRGLPPGPIGSPGSHALLATLEPASTDYLYFVARPGGTHIFSRTLVEHNRAIARARRERERTERQSEGSPESPDGDAFP